MSLASLVEAVSAGVGAALATGETFRRYWTRREAANQAAFRVAVTAIVDDRISDVLQRQTEFERRQGAHLDRQDAAIAALRRAVDRKH